MMLGRLLSFWDGSLVRGQVFYTSGMYFDAFCVVRFPECKTADEMFSVRGFGEYDENTFHAVKEMSMIISQCCFRGSILHHQTGIIVLIR